MIKQTYALLLLMAVVFGCTVPVVAQITTAGISGRVAHEGEPVIGATVVAIHAPSGTRYGTVTNTDGRYTLPNMRAGGPYTVDISYVGYQTKSFANVSLGLGDNYALNTSLDESSELLGEVVVVGNNRVKRKGDRAGAVTSITREGMEAIPTISRSMNDIMRLTPQSSATVNGFAVGGGNYRQSYVTVDGAAFNNSFGIGQNLPANGSPISLDALEQITISLTPYDVRQSGFTGGSINAITRSGDNQWKATAYTYLSNQHLKGIRVGDQRLTRSKEYHNTYGASIGGAIIRNKLFYFVNGEYEANITAGPTTRPRADADAPWGTDDINRPTVGDLELMRNYMANQFGYHTGRYADYDLKTPAYRIMARLDWNINDRNKLNVRFSKTHTKDTNSPTYSVSPFDITKIYPGHGNSGSRTSKYAMTYENSRFYQIRDFMSVAAELNSTFLGGKLNNVVRLTYSDQNEPRETDGGYFPTVDILKEGDVYASFGPDPFTYGNLRKVKTVVATDELTYSTGIHSMLGGVQFEFNHSENGFMPAGAGYYVFSSWDDFANRQKPAAFAVTHPNNNSLTQKNATFNYEQLSFYFQDEMAFSENVKLTAGLRLEIPIYPELKDNYNAEFAGLLFHDRHYATDQMPKGTLNVSPRLGFSWDPTGERTYVLRGGVGLYTGRIPFVWLVSAVGNSNVGQYGMFTYTPEEAPGFHANLDDILGDLYNGTFRKKELPAPQTPTILVEDLKMPAAFKTSLALDARLPHEIDLTLEGIYSRDINPIVVTNAGLNSPSEISLSKHDTRPYYNNGFCALNSEKRGVTPYLIENGGKEAYYYSVSAQLNKQFNFGLDLSLAYTYSHARSYGDGIGDQITSAWKTNTNSVNGSNAHEIGYAGYVAPNRIIASVGYRKEYAKNFASSISLIYEGSQSGYAGMYSSSRFSYTYSNNPLGDGGASPLMYIPASKDELPFADIVESKTGQVTYSKEEQANDFWAFIEQDNYLSKHKGQYAQRNGAIMPWTHQVDLRFKQDFFVKVGSSRNTLQFGVDIKNLGNLLCSNWGLYRQVSTNANTPLKANVSKTGEVTYQMNMNGSQKLTDTFMNHLGFASTSSVQFSVRYLFH